MSKRPAVVHVEASHPLPCPGCGRQKDSRGGEQGWLTFSVKVVGGVALKSFCPSCGPLVDQYMNREKLTALDLRTELDPAINRPSWWRRHVARRGGHT